MFTAWTINEAVGGRGGQLRRGEYASLEDAVQRADAELVGPGGRPKRFIYGVVTDWRGARVYDSRK